MVADVREEAARARARRVRHPGAVGELDGRAPAPARRRRALLRRQRRPRRGRRGGAGGRPPRRGREAAGDGRGDARRLARRARGRGRSTLRLLHPPPPAGRCMRLRDGRAAARGGAHLVRGGYLQDWLLRRTSGTGGSTARCPGRSATLADLGGHFLDPSSTSPAGGSSSIQASTGRLHDERDVGDPPVARAVELEDHAAAAGPPRRRGAGQRARSARSAPAGATACSWSCRWATARWPGATRTPATSASGARPSGFVAEAAAPRDRPAAPASTRSCPTSTGHPRRRARGPAGDVRGRPAQHPADRRRAARAPPRAAGSTCPRRSCSRSPRPGSPVLVLRGPLALGSIRRTDLRPLAGAPATQGRTSDS